MCKQYGETDNFDTSAFADLIVEQTEVGSMMKVHHAINYYTMQTR
jgi:hypothetical protein